MASHMRKRVFSSKFNSIPEILFIEKIAVRVQNQENMKH